MQLDSFYVLGVTYEDLSLVQREEVVKKGSRKILDRLLEIGKIDGYILLETCLRIEIYLETADIEGVKKELNAGVFSIEKNGITGVEYLFQVICGFHSIIKGEDHILSQIKNSYLKELERKNTTKSMNVIFNKAIELGKKFRHKSQISKNALSLEAIALKFIKSHFDDLKNQRILIVGTGEMAVSVLNIFTRNNINNIVMTNRSKKRVIELQKEYQVDALDFKDRYLEIEKSQIIISATAAHHTILENKMMEGLGAMGDKIFLDLGLPRDIDVEIEKHGNIKLYNLDHLWDVYRGNEANRSKLITKYEYLLSDQLDKLIKHFEFKERSRCRNKSLLEQELVS
ncbi:MULTISPECIES: NAD(P)-binding domain-containing protein [Psychrilyobacter]|uniref:Glutamyl-tRNA reductase n=1 Tax=Psychrilyobacter piezotolerans TaxID=2293438 RepID=A0ABX9KIC9_9FUSO|nr:MULTISPECIES: NAD(P)-binding domain-containing protein [Psychrilyobacter]MCS5421662.1 NAD(P)-binding domain-containing protein [Psychrilyobacter sp. S5]NDI77230.1 NAD(P)-binding domain-containing protein [Psychrilyobacter piezotolerans]RDE63288.1 glutamyl-tRNA reductase [Psychrilyobacter sp. S5]REI41830.1 glutamyl-tRNA reductase [Psychrilyobacter piezotolerans]